MRTMTTIVMLLLLVGCSYDLEKAEGDAKDFAKRVPGATGDVSCTKTDTDGDGYCSCTVFTDRGDHVSLDCGCERYCFVCTEGCRIRPEIKGNLGRRR